MDKRAQLDDSSRIEGSRSAGLYCHHSAIVDADRWPDDTVLLNLHAKAVCTRCGMIGANDRHAIPPPGSKKPRASARGFSL